MDGKNLKFVKVCIALVVLQAGFGAYGVMYTKLAKGTQVEPLIFCFYRDGGCAPVLFVVSYFLENKLLIPQVREIPLLVFLGLTGIFLGQLTYILGLINTSPDTASMFTPLVPVICSVLAVSFKIERMPQCTKVGLTKIFGIIIAVLGALIMTWSKQKHHGHNRFGEANSFGVFCMICHLFAKAIWILSQKKFVFQNLNSRLKDVPINLTAWSYFFGSLWMGVTSFATIKDREKYHISSIKVIYCLFYAIFIPSALCYTLITWVNRQVNSSFVTASWALNVLFTVTFSYMILGETLTFLEVLGGFMILMALMAVTWSTYMEGSSQDVFGKDQDKVIKGKENEQIKALLSNMWKQ